MVKLVNKPNFTDITQIIYNHRHKGDFWSLYFKTLKNSLCGQLTKHIRGSHLESSLLLSETRELNFSLAANSPQPHTHTQMEVYWHSFSWEHYLLWAVPTAESLEPALALWEHSSLPGSAQMLIKIQWVPPQGCVFLPNIIAFRTKRISTWCGKTDKVEHHGNWVKLTS